MKAKQFISILVLVFSIFFSFIFTISLYSANASNTGQEYKLRGITLTGDPIAFHNVLISFTLPPGITENAFVRGIGGTIKHTYHLVPAIAAKIPEVAIEALLKNPRVSSIEMDGMIQAIDAELDNTWGVKRIGAGIIHDEGNKGSGVKIAIIDSGIDYNHIDLDLNYSERVIGYDFVNSDNDPMDDNGHGTHVAGIIAALDNETGVVGVAPEAELYALKVLNNSGNGWWSDVIAALQWAVDNGIQVTNNSYSGSQDTDSSIPEAGILQAAFDNSAAAGILHIAAAGNSGNLFGIGDNVGFPARFESAIAVVATNSGDIRAYFSSTGPDVELSSPGVSINSTQMGGGYVLKSGTSMASPHVAGTAALVITTDITDINGNGRINDEVRNRLNETAEDLGAVGRDSRYGYGLVDADEAEHIGDSPPVVSIVDPVESQTVSGNYLVMMEATDDSALYAVELSIDGGEYINITANFDGTYYFYDWNTNTYYDGSHTLRARATDDFFQSTESFLVNVIVKNDSIHVGDLDGTKRVHRKGRWWKVSVTVTIYDASENPVPDATVTGEWSNAANGTVSGTTGSNGTVIFNTGIMRSGDSIKFTVQDVTHSSLTYDSTYNHDPDGDSDGTSITVLKL